METNHDEILKRVEALEDRMSQLEANPPAAHIDYEEPEESSMSGPPEGGTYGSILESKVGEYGLAWLGNLVLFFGLAFLIQYVQKSGYGIGSSALGYISVAGIFTLSYFLQRTLPKMASIFNLNAFLLLFYVSLRLHFFSDNPLVSNKTIGLILIAAVAGIQLFLSIKKKSIFLSSIAIILFSIVAVVSNSSHFMLSISILIAGIAIILLYYFAWLRLFYISIVLAYLLQLIWFLNNPLMGNPLQALSEQSFGIVYLFAAAAIFSLVALAKESDSVNKGFTVSSLLLNGLGFSTLIFLFILSFFKESYVVVVLSISVFCLAYSVLLQLRSSWRISASLYALYGFVTLSIGFHSMYGFPDAYFLLALQSFLVVSMAIWFRSRFIIVMNTLLFVLLLVFYLFTPELIDSVNISFSLVALLTARILNWRKDRLTIQTDLLRNIYLFMGFIMVLITLNHLFPAQYITLSWTAAAVIYFVLSLLLKNVKYRYLALATMVAATFYLFIIDLAKIELVFRIVALLFLALISIGLSIYYTRKSKKKAEINE